ncbi:Enolase 4 [Apodemus speciosus]|uniref:Enolase 4 n=1 Tax=Apodemus speciosus TaxID=105296 RepID=A0ABQ0FTK1_APOSI
MGDEGGGHRGGITRDLQKLKQQAMAYYQENDVPRKLEELLNSTFYLQPADVYGHLAERANYFSKLAKPPSICKIVGKAILDGLGLPTLQVEISCTIQNFPKYICSVAIPTHFEVVENALPEVLDVEEAERDQAVSTAVQWINQFITEELWGLVPSNQAEADHRLRIFFEHKVQEDKERKELERSQEESVPAPPPVIPPPPPPPPAPSKKKGQKAGKLNLHKTNRKLTVLNADRNLNLQGRRDTLLEKPILPPEPPEPVLHGSMAIGAVSLAVAKASATLASTPLYLTLALLKHDQVRAAAHIHNAFADGICTELWEVITWEAKFNERSDLYSQSWIDNQTNWSIELLLEIQKQVNRAMETLPPPKPETKKGHNGGKRAQPPITGKVSHLGCLTINYDTIEQPLLLIQGICSNLGLELGVNFHLAINCAGHELMDYSKGKYEVMVGTYKSAAEMVELYVDLINKYPSIIALIDPFRKEDSEQWDSLYAALASRCYIIAGAASRSISKLLEYRNTSTPKSNGLILKHTNQTTVSDLVEITHLINGKKHLVFGSADSESSDDSLVDLAVGLGARFIKLGGLSRGERMTKYNRLLAIEEELIHSGAWEDATATMAEETLGPLDSIFPTEVIEESVKT